MRRKEDDSTLGRRESGSRESESSQGMESPDASVSYQKEEMKCPLAPKTPSVPGLGTIRLGTLRPEGPTNCTPNRGAKRQLITDLLEADEVRQNSGDSGGGAASYSLRSIISNRSSGKNFDKEIGKGGAFSSYTPEEKVVFARHLNHHLLGDPFLKHLMPLDSNGADLFPKFYDGVLLCRLVSLAVPGSIADTKINVPTGDEPLSLYKSTENLNAALKAADGAGLQVVNIGAADIISGRPASILGLSWQLIRAHLLAQINLKGCPDLIHLMEEGEAEEDFYKLSVEDMLLRWFNHHLRWAGSERRVSNFSDDLADGICYMVLIKELNDKLKREMEGIGVEWPQESEKNKQLNRACLVISGASGIGVAPMIRPRHITGKAQLYNTVFVAQLLNMRPRIHRERLHLQASVKMQAWLRMVRVMRRTNPVLEERKSAAATLTRACRSWVDLRNRHRAATTLQAFLRGGKGRKEASMRRLEVSKQAAAEAAAEAAAKEAAAVREAMAAKEQAAARAAAAAKAAAEVKQESEAKTAEAAAVKQAAAAAKQAAAAAKQAAAAAKKEAAAKKSAAAKKAAAVKKEEAAAKKAAAAAAKKAAATKAEAARAKDGEAKAYAKTGGVATGLQAWARVLMNRDAVAAERGQGSSEDEARKKQAEVGLGEGATPRTSIASSVRFSYGGDSAGVTAEEEQPNGYPERTPEVSSEKSTKGSPEEFTKGSPEMYSVTSPEGFSGKSSEESPDVSLEGSLELPLEGSSEKYTNASREGSSENASERRSRGWFGKVFAEVSFGGKARDGNNQPSISTTDGKEAAAATVIQRWQRGLVEARAAAVRANEEAAYRRWAVRKLHRAYGNRWRYVLAGRRRRRLKWEAEAQRREARKWKRFRWLGDIWAEMTRRGKSVGSNAEAAEEALFRRRWEAQRRAPQKEAEDGHCCDAVGQHVLASEVQAWNISYVRALVLQEPGKGEAQEERARELSRVGTDERAWRSPEDALSVGRVVAMVSVLLTVVYEFALSSAAAVGN